MIFDEDFRRIYQRHNPQSCCENRAGYFGGTQFIHGTILNVYRRNARVDLRGFWPYYHLGFLI